jgi:hypothetical protein
MGFNLFELLTIIGVILIRINLHASVQMLQDTCCIIAFQIKS